MRKATNSRIRIISAFIFFIGFLLIVRLYQIQIHQASAYQEKAERQYVHTAKDVYNRGSVYFTTKDGEKVSAASITSGYLLAVNPTLIENPDEVYEKLTPFTTLSREEFVKKATLPNRTYVEIEPKLDEETYKKVSELDVKGVMLYRNQWRYYPGDAVSARTIGFVGFGSDDGQLRGKYGLER